MSEARVLRDEFERKLQELQDACPHTESEWMPTMWAPGHFGPDARICKRCGKTLEQRELNFKALNNSLLQWKTGKEKKE